MNENIILLAYIIPLLVGTAFMTKAGDTLGTSLSSRYPSLVHRRRRHLLGLNIVTFVGFAISVHTLWISNKISEGGSVCSSATVFSCDDVLGNASYNVDPIFGISWGLIGMFAFGTFLFFANTVAKEPDARWSARYMKWGFYLTASGLLVIGLLISYEIQMEKICQYCTTAHVANVIAMYGFWKASKMHDAGEWKDEEPASSS
ncbi:MAG: vitamin K epoxide reductase family protein [Poseidonia sp.]